MLRFDADRVVRASEVSEHGEMRRGEVEIERNIFKNDFFSDFDETKYCLHFW